MRPGGPRAGELKNGEKFRAIIRHCNFRLKLDDRTVVLAENGDGYKIISDSVEGPGGELSHNWDLIAWEKIQEDISS